jgi:anti-sigma regulatory factor (Ser/Thr protein kinase)
VSRRFPCSPQWVAVARQFVAAALAAADRSEAAEDAMLVVSELATNAVRHALSEFSVEIEVGTAVRVAVLDDVPGMVTVLPLATPADSGRGLAIVASLSDRWGVEPTGWGKRVWSELESRPGP